MTKELDRRFRHVGRIKRSWGTTHKPTIRLMEAMMSGLFERGRLDILRLIQDGTYSPLQVYDAYRTNELERLPTAATLAPLKESMEKWIAKKECSEAHRRSLSQSMRHLIGSGAKSASVGDLPILLASLREKSQAVHPRSFNLARAAAQAFVKSTLKRSHPIYVAITDIEPLPVTAQRHKHPLTPADFHILVKRLPYVHAQAALSMIGTGMGPSEYWGKWELGEYRVTIHGTKRSGRERFVPLFVLPVPPRTEYAAFRRALRDASWGQVAPYDLRRSYANLLESAGIPRTRRKLYLGHGARDVTDLYERHDVERFLQEDIESLSNCFFGATEIGDGLRLVKA